MEKGLKGLSARTLTKIAAIAGLTAGLGGLFSVTKDHALDNDLARLGGKALDPQIQQIKDDKKDMARGDGVFTLGECVGVASMGYAFGRRAERNEKEKGPAR